MTRFNTAIIGCGTVYNVHADALASNPNTRLTAVADIDAARASAAAQKYGCRAYDDYREVLSDPTVDSVHICTPHHLHCAMAIEAMNAGKHVLSEKPMAISVEECEEMIKTSGRTGRQLGICFQNRYNTTSLYIKQLLQSGKTGRILTAKASVTWLRERDYYAGSAWRGKWSTEGGGVLINQAIHTLDLLQWFIGKPIRIKGNTDTRFLKDVIEVEDTAEATILFDSGIHAFFYATNGYAGSPVELEVVCENAVLKLSDSSLTVNYSNGDTESVSDIHPKTGEKAYYGTGHAILIDNFYISLLEGKPFAVDGGQAIEAIRLIRALYRSSSSGCWEEL